MNDVSVLRSLNSTCKLIIGNSITRNCHYTGVLNYPSSHNSINREGIYHSGLSLPPGATPPLLTHPVTSQWEGVWGCERYGSCYTSRNVFDTKLWISICHGNSTLHLVGACRAFVLSLRVLSGVVPLCVLP